MCIRDSYTFFSIRYDDILHIDILDSHLRQAIEEHSPACSVTGYIFDKDITAVSYTHLDVYKRQA